MLNCQFTLNYYIIIIILCQTKLEYQHIENTLIRLGIFCLPASNKCIAVSSTKTALVNILLYYIKQNYDCPLYPLVFNFVRYISFTRALPLFVAFLLRHAHQVSMNYYMEKFKIFNFLIVKARFSMLKHYQKYYDI